MLERVDEIYEGVIEAAEAFRRVGLPTLKVDIPNDLLDLFKGKLYGENPEYEIRYEVPSRETTSLYIVW